LSWEQYYSNSYKKIIKKIRKLKGIAVGFNTNLDAIIEFSGKEILELIQHMKIDAFTLYEKIIEWRGTISEPIDFIAGLCGCFEKGKASEWLIENRDTYYFLIENLPPAMVIRIGGQAGIMSSVLTNLGVPKVIVHTATLSQELKERFNKSKNLVLPMYDKKNQLIFIHPRKAKGLDESLYLHIISEVKKNDTLKINNQMNWRCPRDNRFITSYDPPNIEMQIMQAFKNDIELIAEHIDGLFLSGFHLLDLSILGENGVIEKINEVLSIVKRAKDANPELIVHYEACSTKNEFILEQAYKYSMKDSYWDSLGCNERELVEILRAIGEKRFGNKLHDNFTQKRAIEGCLKIVEKLKLQRLHLHQFGCYLSIARKDHLEDVNYLKTSLCFSSLVAAEKALLGVVSNKLDYNLLLREIDIENNISTTYKQVVKALAAISKSNPESISKTGFIEFDEYWIVSIPTIVIDYPIFTVGLGDTISASALTAELTYKKEKN
jgi:ADP-dependent phosphofructokinase/glucokinase